MPLYAESFRCILIDFLGNGQSDRVENFSPDMWYDEALQTVALTEHLQYGKVSLIGTSGGAYAAINAALLRPELFRCVIADSFDGQRLAPGFSATLRAERAAAKADDMARGFYEWNQGADWERVVDQDTEALVALAESGASLFVRPIETIQVPLLITVSRVDEMLANDMAAECAQLSAANPLIRYKIYEDGAHPLILSKAEEIARVVKRFLFET